MARGLRLLVSYPWVSITLGVLLLAGLASAFDAVAADWLLAGWAIVVAGWQSVGMVRDMLRGHFGLDVLAVTAIVATVAVGDVWAAAVVSLMLTGGEALEQAASARAKRELTALMSRNPQRAHLLRDDDSSVDVPVDQVAIGDVLLVKPGELVPVDAELIDAEAEFDESSLTGESLPVTRIRGEVLASGGVNGSSAIRVRAVASAAESQYQQIVNLVQGASDSRAPFVRLADRYAVPFTLVAVAIAGLAWWLSGDPSRFAEVLVVATPCPLLIAAPVAFIGGMSRAAKQGVIVKGGGTLEQLARVRTAAFDKTGTLTHGQPVLVRIERLGPSSLSDETVLDLAAAAEALSPHVLARVIVQASPEHSAATVARELPGHGVLAEVAGHQVVVGKAKFVAEQTEPFTPHPLDAGEMSVCVAVDGAPTAQLVLRDALRENAAATLARLQQLGVRDTVMLTGDAQPTAEHIAGSIGMTDVRAGLLPADKVAAIAGLPQRPVMMVGDGVNDAPVLAAADVGVALGAKGATAASESADVVILVDDLSKTATSIAIAQRTIRIALQSIWIGIVISALLMVVAAFGVIPAIIGALLQEAVDLASILNSLRSVGEPRRSVEKL